MLRVAQIIAALMIMALPSVALAQKSSGYMNLDDLSSAFGVELVAFRVMISRTDAICPQLTGLYRIEPNGLVTDIQAYLWLTPELRPSADKTVRSMDVMDVSPVPAPDDFTCRRRVAMESCRIDVDISEQQKRDGEWIPLLSDQRPKAVSERLSRNTDPPVWSPAQREAFERFEKARAHVGNLRQGFTGTNRSAVDFEEAKDCFDAVATYRLDQLGVTLLFPAGLDGELNRFFIERVDTDADHSTLYLSRLLPRWVYDQRVYSARWRLDSASRRAAGALVAQVVSASQMRMARLDAHLRALTEAHKMQHKQAQHEMDVAETALGMAPAAAGRHFDARKKNTECDDV